MGESRNSTAVMTSLVKESDLEGAHVLNYLLTHWVGVLHDYVHTKTAELVRIPSA